MAKDTLKDVWLRKIAFKKSRRQKRLARKNENMKENVERRKRPMGYKGRKAS